jgi:hypothetical protein
VITTHPVGRLSFDTHTYYPVSALGALAADSDGNLYFASDGRVRKATSPGIRPAPPRLEDTVVMAARPPGPSCINQPRSRLTRRAAYMWPISPAREFAS